MRILRTKRRTRRPSWRTAAAALGVSAVIGLSCATPPASGPRAPRGPSPHPASPRARAGSPRPTAARPRPPHPPPRISADRILLPAPLRFQPGAASATLTARSRRVLDGLAKLLKARRDLRVLEIQGHVGSVRGGGDLSAYVRSRDMARAVERYLHRRGLAPRRLFATGYGADRPRCDRPTARCRRRNTRIEIRIVARMATPRAQRTPPGPAANLLRIPARRARPRAPATPRRRVISAARLLSRARALRRRGEFKDALALTRKAVRLAPAHLDARELLGVLQVLVGDLGGAIRTAQWMESRGGAERAARLRRLQAEALRRRR